MQVVFAATNISSDTHVSAASVLQSSEQFLTTSDITNTNKLLLHHTNDTLGDYEFVLETATRGLNAVVTSEGIATQQQFSTTLTSDKSHLLLLFALLVLINLIVIIGNILVILAVYATAKLRNVTNIFIVSLATADLMLGLFVLPYALLFEVLDVWIFGEIWCRGWLVTDVWISTASILNLCAISVDRYVAVTRPVKYRSIMTARRARTLVACVWVVSFLICFPPLLQHWTPSAQSSSPSYHHMATPTPSGSAELSSMSLAAPIGGRGGAGGGGAAAVAVAIKEPRRRRKRRRRRRSLLEVTLSRPNLVGSQFRLPESSGRGSLTSREIIWDLQPPSPQENSDNNTNSSQNNSSNNNSGNNNAQPGQLTPANNKGKKNDIKAAYKEEAIIVIDNKLRESSSNSNSGDYSDRERQYISIAAFTSEPPTSTSSSSSSSASISISISSASSSSSSSSSLPSSLSSDETTTGRREKKEVKKQSVHELDGLKSTYLQSTTLSQLLSPLTRTKQQNDPSSKAKLLNDDDDDSLVNKRANLRLLAKQLYKQPAKVDVADMTVPRLLTLLAARAARNGATSSSYPSSQLVKRHCVRSSALVVGGASAAQRPQPNNISDGKRINSHWLEPETTNPLLLFGENYSQLSPSDHFQLLSKQPLKLTFTRANHLIGSTANSATSAPIESHKSAQSELKANVTQSKLSSSSSVLLTEATTRKTTRYQLSSSEARRLSGSSPIHLNFVSWLDDIDYHARMESGHVLLVGASVGPKLESILKAHTSAHKGSSKREKYPQGETTTIHLGSHRSKRALDLDKFSTNNDNNVSDQLILNNNTVPERQRKLGCALFEDKTYVIYSALGSFYIPMLVMVFFYSRIYLVASRAQKALQRGYMTTKWPSRSKLLAAGSNSTSASGKLQNSSKGSLGNFSVGGHQMGSSAGGCERVTLRIHKREKGSLPPPIHPASSTGSHHQDSLPNSPKIFRPNSNQDLDKLLKLTKQLERSAHNIQSSPIEEKKCDDNKTTGERQQLLERRKVEDPTNGMKTNVSNLQEKNLIKVKLESSVNEKIGSNVDQLSTAVSTVPHHTQHHHYHHRNKKHHHSHHHCHHHHRQHHHHHHHHHQHHHHRHLHHQHQQQQHHKYNHSHLTHRENCQHRKSLTSGRHDHLLERKQQEAIHCSSIIEEQARVAAPGGEQRVPETRTSQIDDSLGGSTNSVQIMVSQYNEEETRDAASFASVDLICPKPSLQSSTNNTILNDVGEKQPIRVDRSHSCGPIDTPTVVVSWNPNSVAQNGSEAQVSIVRQASEQALGSAEREATSDRLLIAQTGSRSASGSKSNAALGSQGSGLSLIASLPQAANQVRKQSMMLLSSITSKSSQTLRRLSVVASHPVESLLQRSHANSISSSSSSSSSSFSTSNQLEEFTSGKNEGEEGVVGVGVATVGQLEEQKKRRVKHHKKKKGKRKKKRRRQDLAHKKTFDDYLMAVAGIDGSSDEDEVNDDDDDDDDEDQEDDIDDDILAGNGEKSSRIEYPSLLYSLQCRSSSSPKPDLLVTSPELKVDEKLSTESKNGQEELVVQTSELVNSSIQEEEKDNNNQAYNEVQEVIARPPSALQRKGACYERATSRASTVCERPALSMVSAIRLTLNGFSSLSGISKGKSETKVSTLSPAIRLEASNSSDQQRQQQQQQSDQAKQANMNMNSKVRRRPAKRTSRWHAKRLHAETKAAKTVAVIVGGFIFCWLPFFTAYLSRAIICERPDCIPQSLLSLFIWLGYLNSAINPVIYGLLSADFRHAFKNILCRCRFRSHDDTVVVSVLVDSIIKSIL